MPYLIKTTNEHEDVQLYYEDHGSGRPLVFVHAWPLDSSAFEKQVVPLLKAGFRVVLYDRRGFGRSARPSWGYDLDTLSSDLQFLVDALELQNAVLIGHSMGGGEVVRCLSRFRSPRIRAAVYIAAINPFLLQTGDHPEGVPAEVFSGLQAALRQDRFAVLASALRGYYNHNAPGALPVSDETLSANFMLAVAASPIALHDCVSTWTADLREDHASVQLPTLIIHGTADASAPYALTAEKTAAYGNSTVAAVEGAPHGLIWTHAEEVNHALMRFLGV